MSILGNSMVSKRSLCLVVSSSFREADSHRRFVQAAVEHPRSYPRSTGPPYALNTLISKVVNSYRRQCATWFPHFIWSLGVVNVSILLADCRDSDLAMDTSRKRRNRWEHAGFIYSPMDRHQKRGLSPGRRDLKCMQPVRDTLWTPGLVTRSCEWKMVWTPCLEACDLARGTGIRLGSR